MEYQKIYYLRERSLKLKNIFIFLIKKALSLNPFIYDII